jgi:uncharacterized DUF497 family protein
MAEVAFEWDNRKQAENLAKHGVDFLLAQAAFLDPQRIIASDNAHSSREARYYCFGKVGDSILTVRFTLRAGKIRIIGAGYWRKGRKHYEKTHQIHG